MKPPDSSEISFSSAAATLLAIRRFLLLVLALDSFILFEDIVVTYERRLICNVYEQNFGPMIRLTTNLLNDYCALNFCVER
mmetsp:Transcript_6646/g.9713  ORF Transcript_6646/g.9713 Transcript_6646/m.9713 type:complete len:81 (-) Transcript_6646:152-394(-)